MLTATSPGPRAQKLRVRKKCVCAKIARAQKMRVRKNCVCAKIARSCNCVGKV